ncbi:hypothetical protein N8456_07930 [Porticoccaceae bacterium]|nr:hypothetical protein [Porticoccaceae bacterium]
MALYSLSVFTVGISYFSLEAYGSMMISVFVFALCARIISFGFDYKIRDLIEDHGVTLVDVLIVKLILAATVTLCIFVYHLVFGPIEYIGLMVVAFFVYSFDTMPYFQAKDRYEKPAFFVLGSLVIGSVFLWNELNAGSLTRVKFLAACILVPSFGWVLVSLREIFEEGLKPDISKCQVIMREAFAMFTVVQLPGLYVNVLPIIVGLQSEVYVAMYSIVSRISNFGKSFGQVVNQVFFYKTNNGRSNSNVLISILGSLIVGTVCSYLIFNYFSQKLDGSFESLGELMMLVALFSIMGAATNFLIIKVFF